MNIVELTERPPPEAWGVTVDPDAIARLAGTWRNDRFPLPDFAYPGIPAQRDGGWWFDYVTVSVSVLACLWPPPGEEVWHTELDGRWLDDAPGIFAVFTRLVDGERFPLDRLAGMDDKEGAELFRGRGTLQMIPERVAVIRAVAATLIDQWGGTAANLVAGAKRDGRRIAGLLAESVPGYHDRARTDEGILPFDKLAHLAAAVMAAGAGWDAGGFHGYDDFPVYPDYMLPRVFRHAGILRYAPDLADRVDRGETIPAGSPHEHAIRWATVFAGGRLRAALHLLGNPVTAPALDYRLWSEAVLGPDAASFGEHHRTITLNY